MKLRQLESALQDVQAFTTPVVKWEQYPTSPHIAAHMLYTMNSSYDDIEGKIVGDLGCGGGILGIGAAILGSGHTVGFDIDPSALAIAQENCKEFEVEIDYIITNVEKLNIRAPLFDTIIMNPPFGTKIKGIDMVFLEKAFKMAKTAVYSLHKSSTREFILKQTKKWGVNGEVLAELRWDIPKMYNFHKKQSVDIEVDFIRFEIPQK
eukprot:Phypoly_transcript_06605.p2 GENE.Phypoly_transcript_06605~~Phypoly_transcript_06605.p2  ORF type:complete len:207 (-),score=42.01 Phypoly_transcript_06605:60-680(-)